MQHGEPRQLVGRVGRHCLAFGRWLVVVLAWATSVHAQGTAVPDRAALVAYEISRGDKLSISVYDEPDLSMKEVLVRGRGVISFPLIGELQVAGQTARMVEDEITRRLGEGYLKNPDVTVSIDAYRLYFIKGEVKRPGGYSFAEGLTVAKAIAMARGYTERAAEEKISILRESAPHRAESATVESAVYPGDIVTIGQSFF